MKQEALQKLKEFLIDGEFINLKGIAEVEEEAKKSGRTFEDVLYEKDYLSSSHLGQLIAEANMWKFIKLGSTEIDENILRMIPQKVAKKQLVLAFGEDESGIKVAINNPENHSLLSLLKKRLGKEIIPYYAAADDIKNELTRYKSNIKEEFEAIISAEAERATKKESKESATVQIVNMLIDRGYDSDASDIHIEPFEAFTLIRFRVDGVMKDVIKVPRSIHDLIISRIKVMSHLRTDEHQKPQDGKIVYQLNGEKVDIRISIVPTTKGENAVLRLLSEKSKQYTLEEIGLAFKDFEKLSRSIKKPWGLILVTGPTGSGKTTTLYAILKILNMREVNIATIEDPVEYNIDGITQIQVNSKTDLTFASGLRSIVRQDPDTIMVGEIRDKDTADIAVNSAMTGHLVLSTLHTNDAATTLPRLLDMEVEQFLVSSTVNLVIAQRLLRKICSHCIQSYETDLSDLSGKIPVSILERLGRNQENVTLYKGTGCQVCNHTGYAGRTGVFELLEVDDDIRSLIMSNTDADTIKERAVQKGMTTMLDDAINKVLNGVTTIEEMLRVVRS